MARRTTKTLTVEVPVDLLNRIIDIAGESHRLVDQLVISLLAHEVSRWDAMIELPAPPADFQRALDADPAAATFFATIDARNYHAVLIRIEDAKRPDTRARRIDQAIGMLSRKETPYGH
jgi:uncharacterized protein YdeI (YjbR/CyaY-like superfamily)